jgi:hypothetical protein
MPLTMTVDREHRLARITASERYGLGDVVQMITQLPPTMDMLWDVRDGATQHPPLSAIRATAAPLRPCWRRLAWMTLHCVCWRRLCTRLTSATGEKRRPRQSVLMRSYAAGCISI